MNCQKVRELLPWLAAGGCGTCSTPRTQPKIWPTGLIFRLGGVGVGFLWSRFRATRAFRRRLRQAGLPPELARLLAQDYRRMVSLPRSKGTKNLGFN